MKKGFTLAEVLITLAIIGVVAALTIPIVMKGFQKQATVAKLKDAFGTFSRVLQTAEAEHGSIASWYSENDITLRENDNQIPILNAFANKYLIPYMNVTDSGEKKLEEFGYKKGIFLPGGGIQYVPTKTYFGMKIANGMFILVNTASIVPDDTNDARRWTAAFDFYVDIDGPSHGANTLGKDVFAFRKHFSSDVHIAQLTMLGLLESRFYLHSDNSASLDHYRFRTREEIKNICKTDTDGSTCGALIMIDGWKISDDYPWL